MSTINSLSYRGCGGEVQTLRCTLLNLRHQSHRKREREKEKREREERGKRVEFTKVDRMDGLKHLETEGECNKKEKKNHNFKNKNNSEEKNKLINRRRNKNK